MHNQDRDSVLLFVVHATFSRVLSSGQLPLWLEEGCQQRWGQHAALFVSRAGMRREESVNR